MRPGSRLGSAQDNYFENNLVYAGTYNQCIYSFVKSSTSYPAPPATLNANLYHSTAGSVQGTSTARAVPIPRHCWRAERGIYCTSNRLDSGFFHGKQSLFPFETPTIAT
jgi:hypothetical protein